MIYEICELADIIDGDRGSNYPKQDEFSSAGYCLFLNAGNVTSSGFMFEENMFITKEKDSILRKGKLSRGDIIYTTRGTVGNAAYYHDKVPFEHVRINSGMVILRCKRDVVDERYLYLLLKSEYYRPYFKKYCTGSAQPQLPIKTFSKIQLDIPSLEVQRRIADILSAYDDLIENNQKQIKLLEEAAQRLYREWFVELRFPGHESTTVVDGVPEGWEIKSVADCLSFHGNGGWGKETPTGQYTHAGKVIRGTDIPDIRAGQFGDVPLRYHTDVDVHKRVLKKNDLVFELSNGNIDNIGRCLLIDDMTLQTCGKNTICASFCKLLRPIDQLHAVMLYFEIQDMQSSGRMLPLKKHGSNGINNFDFEGFLSHRFVIPANARCISTLTSILSKISVMRNQMFCLREARDRLLPKLMSGEVEV